MTSSVIFVAVCVLLQTVLATNQVILTCGNQQNEPAERGLPGPPGKRGSIGRKGSAGPRGSKGEPGESDTWRSAFEEMQARISVLEKAENIRQHQNCQQHLRSGHNRSGLFDVYIPRLNEGVSVYCDQRTDGGGWMVIQRRTDGSEEFYRNWNDYRRGFGNKSNEFWLGLDLIHDLTTSDSYELRVDIEDFDGGSAFAKYSIFRVGSAADVFKLVVGGYSGNAGDALSPQNGQKFTTNDQDNDQSTSNCAQSFHGAWWYNACHHSNLNGEYLLDGQITPRGISWYDWKSSHYSLKRVEMKTRPL